MSVYKLYSKQVRDNENYVYLYLYRLNTGEKVPRLTSLRIKLNKRYCILDKSNNFKKVSKEIPKQDLLKLGFESVDKLNIFLQEELEKFIINNGVKSFVPKERKTLNDWINIQIKRTLNQGTKMRYRNILNLIQQFQRHHSVSLKKLETETIFMSEIDVNYISNFKEWLLSKPLKGENRKRNTLNSCNYKLKCLKSFIRKSHSEEYYPFPNNPFEHIGFSFEEKTLEVLDIEDLTKLINTKYVEVYRRTQRTKEGINLWGRTIEGGIEKRNEKNRRYIPKHSLTDIKNYFLFQLLSQGIRVSDLVTLRWSHFHFDKDVCRIKKTMVKTHKEISILVNEKMTSIISHYVTRYSDLFPVLVDEIDSINKKIKNISHYLFDDYYVSVDYTCPYHRYFEIIKDSLEHKYVHRNIYFLVGMSQLEFLKDSLLKLEKREIFDLIENTHKEPSDKPKKPIHPKWDKDHQIQILIENIKIWILKQKKESIKIYHKKYETLRDRRGQVMLEIIKKLKMTQEVKDDFVFTLMDKEYFRDILGDDFSRMTELQYRKFQSVRCYYNKLLKLVGEQSGIQKRLTSHLSRHSYTSLMIELGENINLYDLMTSLGHKHLSTTQIYIQKISNKKVDELNLIISNKLDHGLKMNI